MRIVVVKEERMGKKMTDLEERKKIQEYEDNRKLEEEVLKRARENPINFTTNEKNYEQPFDEPRDSVTTAVIVILCILSIFGIICMIGGLISNNLYILLIGFFMVCEVILVYALFSFLTSINNNLIEICKNTKK